MSRSAARCTGTKAAGAPALFQYCLRLGDNALVLGHRLSEWSSRAPTLEIDIALSNLALDLIGQARMLLSYAGEAEGAGRDEDALAYHRDVLDFRNVLLVEQPNGDFAHTIARHVFYAVCARAMYEALCQSRDTTLAAIAAKAVKEMTYHERYAGEWLVRLGDGTRESRTRAQAAIDRLWPLTGELFETDQVENELSARGIVPDMSGLQPLWRARIEEILARATLARPEECPMLSGGRSGHHGEHLGHLLAELQYLPRAYPGAVW